MTDIIEHRHINPLAFAQIYLRHHPTATHQEIQAAFERAEATAQELVKRPPWIDERETGDLSSFVKSITGEDT